MFSGNIIWYLELAKLLIYYLPMYLLVTNLDSKVQ